MSKKTAFGGIMTALCVILIYLAAYLPTGRLGIYALSSLVIAGAVIELGIRWGTVVYAASSVLTFLLTGNISAFLIFTLLFGVYPLIKYCIEKRRGPAVEVILKLLTANLLGILSYYIYKALTGLSPIVLPKLSVWMVVGAAAVLQVVFLIYDYILSRLIVYYNNRIKLIR